MANVVCPRCGTVNMEGSLFCENCGTRLPQPAAPAGQGGPMPAGPAPATVKKKGKGGLIAVIALIAALAVGGGVFAFMHLSKEEPTEIDLVSGFDDKVLNLSGEDGEGSINGFDYDAIHEKLNYNDQTDEAKEFIDSVTYSTDKSDSTSLYNGEKVRITCEYDESKAEELGFKVRNGKAGAVESTVVIKCLKAKEPEAAEGSASSTQPATSGGSSDSYSSYGADPSMITEYVRSEDDDMIREVLTTQELTLDDIKDMNRREIQRLCNYFYVMHGYELNSKNPDYKYFSSQSWYAPTTDDQDEAAKDFNYYEYNNEKLIGERRDYLKAKE